MEQIIPWPVSLGIAGGSVALLLSFLYWMLRKLANGDWVPRIQHEAAILLERQRATDVIAANAQAAIDQVANQKVRGDEWKETALVEREGRAVQTDIARNAVEGLQRVSYAFPDPQPLPLTPTKAHDSTQEVQS